MRIRAREGFTLIELVMVIVILGILAAVAIPKFANLTDQANEAAEKGVVGGVRAGIYTYYAENRAYPNTLGNTGDASNTNPLFGTVLGQGAVTADWSAEGQVYTGPTGSTYTYDPSDGSFLQD